MLCVECAAPVQFLYTKYSEDNIKATTCTNCNKFADKYIEYDPVLVALDVALLRPQAIRHVVFNVLKSSPALFYRMHLLILLFDVYIKWALLEKIASDPNLTSWFARTATLQQYVAFLTVSATDILVINAMVYILVRLRGSVPDLTALFITLLLASLSRLLPLLTVIWDYETTKVLDLSLYIFGLITADFLQVVMKCSYLHSLIITATALAARWLICDKILWPWIMS